MSGRLFQSIPYQLVPLPSRSTIDSEEDSLSVVMNCIIR